jgi:hypothetical protein
MKKDIELHKDNNIPLSRLLFESFKGSESNYPKQDINVSVKSAYSNKITPYPFYKKIVREL